MPIEAVVYDIGNVLLEWNPHRFYDAAIGPDRRRALFAEVPLDAMNQTVDLGAEFSASVAALADRHPGWGAEILLWRDRWIEMARPEMALSAHLLRRLRARDVPVFALSNFGTATFEIACRAYPVLTEFDRSYISGHLGVIKPDPRIYEILETDCGVAPARLLFADDKAENIAAAAARGWHGHLFETAEGWADRLVAEGLLDVEDIAA